MIEDLLARLRSLDIRLWLDGEALRFAAPPGSLTAELKAEIKSRKSEIIDFLRRVEVDGAGASTPIPVRDPDTPAPLSFAQQRMWLVDQLSGDTDAYNMYSALRLQGDLNEDALIRTLGEIVARHETLRTTFPAVDGYATQVVADEIPLPLVTMDFSALEADEAEKQLVNFVAQETGRPFDLGKGPIIRFALLKASDVDHVLVITMHHIVSDGWSIGVLNREISQLYEAFESGRPSPLPKLTIQYADFSVWQRKWLQGDVLERQVAYWRRQLAGLSTLELLTDRPHPRVQTFDGAMHSAALPKRVADGLAKLANEEGVTLSIVLTAAFDILLHRYTGQTDIVVGSPIANRNRKEIEGLIGFFVNTLVIRSDLSGNPTVRELLRRVADVAVDAYDHQDLPFEQLVDELQPERDPSRNPLFQVMLAVQNAPTANLELGEVSVAPFVQGLQTTRFDLECHLVPHADTMAALLIYKTGLFDADTIEAMMGHFLRLLEGIVADPDERIGSVSILTDADSERLLSLKGREVPYPADRTAIGIFEERAERTPDATAVSFGGNLLTYGALNSRANQLAHELVESGVELETPVAICTRRGIEAVIAAIAVWKAGGAYVPMDPKYPVGRLEYMLEDSAAPVILTQRDVQSTLPRPPGCTVISIDDPRETRPDTNPVGGVQARNAAYVIYTSGSTGRPKGVVVEHASLLNLVAWHQEAYDLDPSSRTTQIANLAFDASVWEMWPTLLAGATLHIPPDEVVAVPENLVRWMCDEEITVSFLPTPLAEVAIRESWPEGSALRFLLTGGDRLRSIPDAPLPFVLVNHYGPTENTVVATCCSVQPGTAAPAIGEPIANNYVRVLDAHMAQVPLGAPGELFVGGASLSRGYLNRPELTAERFIRDPFSDDPEARLYATGDVVRCRKDGLLDFLGRNDEQAKVRGYRIELGEVEASLSSDPTVSEIVALARRDAAGEARLVAYVVPDRVAVGENPEFAEAVEAGPEALEQALIPYWRRVMSESLPDYMVPTAFVILEEMPITPNGKIDRKALPDPGSRRQISAPATLPVGETEEILAAIWRELLDVEVIGVHDNFFDLGGHSLMLVRVHGRVVEEIETDLKVVELFEFPTIAALARRIGGEAVDSGVLAEARSRVRTRGEAAGDHKIAVVGMSGRFPGAPDIDALWENLRKGIESIRHFSREELEDAGVPAEMLDDPAFVRARGWLEGADLFDAGFFGYAPREAEIMDPQQRLFLECAWSTLEHAGYAPDQYDGLVGVFGGASRNTYQMNVQSRPDLAALAGLQAVLGAGSDFLTTRVSYKLGLKGPSVNVQTACSTSLVAVHMACRSLRDNECDVALAGGVAISVPMEHGYFYQEDGIGSPDGHCRPFDARAKGTVNGSGVAMVALRRLSDALADGDHIHAVICGSAINNDGSSRVGFTAPGVDGQSRVIAMALADAEVAPESVGYVEAHGTATNLGDPIEVAALSRAYGLVREDERRCGLGSLKSNVGHLDAAAGVSGLIKAVLCVSRGELVPSLHFERPNPEIDLDASAFFVTTENREWEGFDGGPRRAAVSSFGLGGTNAHVILEQAPEAVAVDRPGRPWSVLPLSAESRGSLSMAGERLARHLTSGTATNIDDVAYTLQVARKALKHRRAVLANGSEGAVEALTEQGHPRAWSGSVARAARVAFMFPGQGAQYPDMGRGLYETEPVFRDTVDAVAERVNEAIGKDLREILYPPLNSDQSDELTSRTLVTQSGLFATELAMARLWQSWGIEPVACIGHSIGEYVAACFSGAISLDDALRLLCVRGNLMENAPQGAMLAVALGEDLVTSRLIEGVWLSAVNGPEACVVAGRPERVEAMEASLAADGVKCRRLHTAGAFHSGLMDPVIGPLEVEARTISVREPEIRFISNVTGSWASADQMDAGYWGRHVREPVRFDTGIRELIASGVTALLEVGPGNTLGTLARRRLRADDNEDVVVLTSLRHARQDAEDHETVGEALGRLWVHGASPDWHACYGDTPPRRVPLPTYPFEPTRYWIEPGAGGAPSYQAPVQGRGQLRDWFHVPVWSRAVLSRTPVPEAEGEGPWLVLVDRGPLGDSIASLLEGEGREVVRVAPGDDFESLGATSFCVDPTDPAHFGRLLHALEESRRSPSRVVHMWGLAQDPEDTLAFERGFYGLLYLLQSLRTDRDEPLHVTAVTNGMFSIAGEEAWVPQRAGMTALCRVAPQNNPDIRCSVLDVDSGFSGARVGRVRDLLRAIESPADQISAIRSGSAWVRSLQPRPLDPVGPGTGAFRKEGVYVITGGLGNMGLALARHLAENYQARLVLIGRSALPETDDEVVAPRLAHARAVVQELEAAGAEVLSIQADVSDSGAVGRALTAAEERFGTIHGVIHAAGVTHGESLRTLPELTRAHCEAQFSPKWHGVVALHEAVGDRVLDFCFVTSSLSVELGGLQFGAYAAANTIMDALVDQYDREGRTRWVTVDFDGWDFGDIEEDGVASFGLSPAEGCDAFERVLSVDGLGTATVCTGDFRARLAGSLPQASEPVPAGTMYERPDLDTDFVAPRDESETIIAAAWMEVLGLDRVGVFDDFFELGGDSLVAIQLMGRLSSTFGVEVGVQALFDAPTVGALSTHIQELRDDAQEDAAQLAMLEQMVAQMTDEEVEAALRSGDLDLLGLGEDPAE